MKDVNEIKEMLDAFYGGETTKEEESLLRAYFSNDDLPEEMQSEKEIFLILLEPETPPIPKGVENRLSSLIDKLEKNESKKAQVHNFSKKKKKWFEIAGIAASICLLISIGLFVLNQDNERNPNAREIGNSVRRLNPEEQKKIIEAQKALEMVSTNFNKGLEGIQSVSDNL